MFMQNKCCYTCLIGPYEELKDPTVPQSGWDFICFTDQPIISIVWKIVQVTVPPDLTAQRFARAIKLQPHIYLPDYQFTFWLDAAFQINIDLNIFWNKYFKSPFTVPAHPLRHCWTQEINSCISNKRGDEVELRLQEMAYKEQDVPRFKGIITSGVMMRENTPECIKLCAEWWEEVCRHSVRDQVAFAKIGRNYEHYLFAWDYSQSKELKYFRHYHHRH